MYKSLAGGLRILILAFFIGLLILVNQANAATVSVEVYGQVTSSSIPALPVGEPISGRITYDNSAVPDVGIIELSVVMHLNGTLTLMLAGQTFEHIDDPGAIHFPTVGFSDGLVTGMDLANQGFDAYGLTNLNFATTPGEGPPTDQFLIEQAPIAIILAEGMFIFSGPPVILDVRDVDTPGLPSVIHVGGLTEDVSAFVDRGPRQHWINVPQSLEGADYIESAQDNADVSDDRGTSLLIEVDVVEGAVLYMFINERSGIGTVLPTPFPWMNFADFGADWVDSGLDISSKFDDRIFNIWRTVGSLAAGTYNFRQLPIDSSFYGIAALLDTDGDGVVDNDDYCANTTIPEGVPWVQLRPNRWALIDDGSEFDTVINEGPKRSYTIEDTAGCSCEQIIEMQGLGNGHSYYGCSIGAMDNWVDLVTP